MAEYIKRTVTKTELSDVERIEVTGADSEDAYITIHFVNGDSMSSTMRTYYLRQLLEDANRMLTF